MLRQLLLAIVLLLHIGLSFAQKIPASPFSWDANGTKASLPNANALPKADLPLITIGAGDTSLPFGNVPINSATPSETNNVTWFNPKKEAEKTLDNIAEKVTDKFAVKINTYAKALINAALRILVYLTAFMIIWNLLKFALSGGHNFNEFIANIVIMIVMYKFTYAFIEHGPDVSDAIINWFREVAKSATQSADFKPATLLDLAGEYFTNLLKSVFMDFDIGKAITTLSIAGLTSIILAVLVAYYVSAVVESLLLAKISIVLLGFSTFAPLRDIGFKPINIWIYIGLKLMFLQLIIGLEIDLLRDFLITKHPDVTDCVAALFVTIITAVVTWRVPIIFSNLLNGSTNIGGSAELMKAMVIQLKALTKGGVVGMAKQAAGAAAFIQAHEKNQQAKQANWAMNNALMPQGAQSSNGGSYIENFLNQGRGDVSGVRASVSSPNAGRNSGNSLTPSSTTTNSTANNASSTFQNFSASSNESFNASSSNNAFNSGGSSSTALKNTSIASNANNSADLNMQNANTSMSASMNVGGGNNAFSASASLSNNNQVNNPSNNIQNNELPQKQESFFKSLGGTIKDFAMDGIKDDIYKNTIGGRAAQILNAKTQDLENKAMKSEINNMYKNVNKDNSENKKTEFESVTNTIEKNTAK